MRCVCILILICFALQQITNAQIPPTFQVRYYTTENGLPSNSIKGIQWDEETSFLWFATEAGIVRFNGVDFKTFSNQNTSFITTERISFLTRSNQNSICGVDLDGNILKVQQNNLVLYRRIPGFPGFFESGLEGLDVSDAFLNHKIAHPGELAVRPFFKKMALTDTSLFFINEGKAFLVSMNKENALPLELGDRPLKTCFKTGNKFFVTDDNNQIFILDAAMKTLAPAPIQDDGQFSVKLREKDTRLFWENGSKVPIVINHSTAWELVYDGTKLAAKKICDDVPEDAFIQSALYNEERKLLFLGTASKGLIIISENGVAPVKNKSGTHERNAYYSQVELDDGDILTNEGHIIGMQQKRNAPIPIRGRFRFNTYITRDSLLWYSQADYLGGDLRLFSYSYATGQTLEYTTIGRSDNFALTYSGDKKYIATVFGFGELRQDSVHYLFRKTGIVPYNMVEISPGIFVLASCESLLRFNLTTNKMDTILSAPDNCIRSLWKFNNYLFIGTYGKGYFIYKNGTLKSMPLDKNNFLSHVHCFAPDKYGYCWMSTNHGLFKAKVSDLVRAFESDGKNIYYHYFGRNDGMNTTEMNGGCTPCALQMKSGTISFPTMDGLLWVTPSQTLSILPTGNIFIDNMEADDKKINIDSLAFKGLPAGTKEIAVELGFSAWCNKENLYIDYDLDNSGKWKPVNTDAGAFVHLYSLSPGSHSLRIRKMNGFGPENYSYRELRFRLNTPWHQQWWFYVLIALLTLAIGGLYIRWRTRQYVIRQRKLEQQVFEKTKELQLKNEILEKNDTIKTRLISIISHDIITPLKFLTVAGKNLLQKKQMMSEEMQNETISEITNTSQDLQLLSTNILNWIKYQDENRRMVKENFHVHELINQVLSILSSLAKQKQLHLLNDVDKELTLYQFAEPLRILIYNLVSNAINFSDKGTIAISNRNEPDFLVINVQDEGTGMTPEQINNIMADQVVISAARSDSRKGHGLGYLIIKDLIKMIGAELSINSEKGKGTTVSIKIPTT